MRPQNPAWRVERPNGRPRQQPFAEATCLADSLLRSHLTPGLFGVWLSSPPKNAACWTQEMLLTCHPSPCTTESCPHESFPTRMRDTDAKPWGLRFPLDNCPACSASPRSASTTSPSFQENNSNQCQTKDPYLCLAGTFPKFPRKLQTPQLLQTQTRGPYSSPAGASWKTWSNARPCSCLSGTFPTLKETKGKRASTLGDLEAQSNRWLLGKEYPSCLLVRHRSANPLLKNISGPMGPQKTIPLKLRSLGYPCAHANGHLRAAAAREKTVKKQRRTKGPFSSLDYISGAPDHHFSKRCACISRTPPITCGDLFNKRGRLQTTTTHVPR